VEKSDLIDVYKKSHQACQCKIVFRLTATFMLQLIKNAERNSLAKNSCIKIIDSRQLKGKIVNCNSRMKFQN
jgi:UDP-N-acetyl-D-mannosaminuronic acid transferase (WecB/TagA/CpsF family)